jgi:hypothetical protein
MLNDPEFPFEKSLDDDGSMSWASIDSFANRTNASAGRFRNRESLVGRILERSKSRPDRFPRHDSFKAFIVKHLHRFRFLARKLI